MSPQGASGATLDAPRVATRPRWTFLTNHAHVLLALYRQPDLRQRDISDQVGITEGAVQRILNDLVDQGYLSVERHGRRNHYRVHDDRSLRHPMEHGHTVGEILERLGPDGGGVTVL